jgi:hypothetical protein
VCRIIACLRYGGKELTSLGCATIIVAQPRPKAKVKSKKAKLEAGIK